MTGVDTRCVGLVNSSIKGAATAAAIGIIGSGTTT